ncbi:unnamed protein product [Aureobasidium uvarum]|uniref:Flavin reductase like domain-containing protein n=1 Tax=Aureobasidium uvarum TaxID=2773716 RepID=A0A9N8PUH2_9PEZI|nr:unnamed protein product [Aureobasidium uvarum]
MSLLGQSTGSIGRISKAHRSTAKGSAPCVKIDYAALKGKDQKLLPFEPATRISVTASPDPNWTYGKGTGETKSADEHAHIEIDPFGPGRPMLHNYTLLVSSIAPRPIGLISTVSKDGKQNLAPFSYFQVVDHDPPIFVVGFSGRASRPKDTLQNLKDTGECTFNLVSEDMIEAVNATSIDAPRGLSEWSFSGLTKTASTTVTPPRVKESVVSIEGKLSEIVEYKTSRPAVGGAPGTLAIIEATRFWVKANAIDDKRSHVDLSHFRPVGQLGGVSYARMTDTFELPRTNWARSGLKGTEWAKHENL